MAETGTLAVVTAAAPTLVTKAACASATNAGVFYAIDANPSDGHNMLAAGSPVSIAVAIMQPTDNMYLQGVSQADIDQAFAKLAANPQPGAVDLSLPRAGGSALSLWLPNQGTAR